MLEGLDKGLANLKRRQERELARVKALRAKLGPKNAPRGQIGLVRDRHRSEIRNLKDGQRSQRQAVRQRIRTGQKDLELVERRFKLMTNRGRLELASADAAILEALQSAWIDGETARCLDYRVFMAVSERGGKDPSGNYQFLTDEEGGLRQFAAGHPQEGQPIVDQDLVNYDLGNDDLADASQIAEGRIRIAEAFVRFAQEEGLNFWSER